MNIVDFGAGSAITMCAVANHLKDDINEGKVRIIATNIDAVPTREDIPLIKSVFDPTHAALFTDALTKRTIDFAKSDILELHELMK